MKCSTILCILISFLLPVSAQTYKEIPGTGYIWERGFFKKTLHLPQGTGPDLPSPNNLAGALRWNTSIDSVQVWDGSIWRNIGAGSDISLDDIYTKSQLQTSGQSQVHWNNITSKPTLTNGTVRSVALALPGIFSVTGSPVTTTGTITGSFVAQSANRIFAGPASGAAAAPAFRSLAASDIPGLDAGKITTGIIGVGRGGTGLATVGSANQMLRVNAGGTALEYFTPNFAPGPASAYIHNQNAAPQPADFNISGQGTFGQRIAVGPGAGTPLSTIAKGYFSENLPDLNTFFIVDNLRTAESSQGIRSGIVLSAQSVGGGNNAQSQLYTDGQDGTFRIIHRIGSNSTINVIGTTNDGTISVGNGLFVNSDGNVTVPTGRLQMLAPSVSEGGTTAPRMGIATFPAGVTSVNVLTAAVKTNSRIFLTTQESSNPLSQATYSISSRVPDTSFTITWAKSAADSGKIAWLIVEPF